MASFRSLGFVTVASAAVLSSFVGCGGRTDRLPGEGGGAAAAGHAGSAGDGSGGAGSGGGGGPGGIGAYPGYGGYSAGGGNPGYGGYYPGYGGYYPGYGGYYGAGGGIGCVWPTCNCGDCMSACECYAPGTDCYSSCYGGSGGYPGSGGASSCNCPSVQLAFGGVSIPGCCLPDGSCGAEVDMLTPVLPIAGGCQNVNRFGTLDPACSELSQPGSISTPGCCLQDGLCGQDLGIVGLGCLPRSVSATVEKCDPNGSAGSSSVEQCKAAATSPCTSCACETCGAAMNACVETPGCQDMLLCFLQTGCTTDCYTSCQTVVDAAGGPGSASARVAAELRGCAASCPCRVIPL
ncbi:MAG TPA: hypothetical protein VHE30_18595 [Polyangiaceae bacterium]|nr:hypothetical protein [Polyangiaceae bacterium]